MAPPPVPIPDLLKGIDELVRTDLEAFRDVWFNRLLMATGAVVIGLIAEGPELLHDIASIIRRWRLGHRFHLSLPERSASDWTRLLAFVGWILIVVGVAGEFVADRFLSKADGYVQRFDEILLVEAQREAGDAKTSALIAKNASDGAVRAASDASTLASDASRQASAAKDDSRRAQEKANVVEKDAAALARELGATKANLTELVDSLAPRGPFMIRHQNGKPDLPELMPYAGISFQIKVLRETEPLSAAESLLGLLKAAHWSPSSLQQIEVGAEDIPEGVSVDGYMAPHMYNSSIPETGQDAADGENCKNAMMALEVFLHAHSWDASRLFVTPIGSVPHNTIIIRVGPKPNPYFLPKFLKDMRRRQYEFQKQLYEEEQRDFSGPKSPH